MDSIKGKIGYISLAVSIINLVTAVTGLITNLFSQAWFQGVYVVLSVLVIVCFVFFYQNKKADHKAIVELSNKTIALEDENELFRANICSGLELLSNTVTIEFVKASGTEPAKYKLTFDKMCRVIGESKWYSGQVYFNSNLINEEESEAFYENNKLEWDMLNPSARIVAYSKDGTSAMQDAEIYPVAKSARYFQFHIRYGTADERIDPQNYEKFEIIYSYEVPISHWGSYINRTISCFGEPTTVLFKLFSNISANRQKRLSREFQAEVRVYEKKLDDEPSLLATVTCDEKGIADGYINLEVNLPSSRAQKYIVSWDPSKYFGNDVQRTTIVKDSAELTAH